MIHDNLRNMLLTNNGERLGRYDFGASLRSLTHEVVASDNFESTVMANIDRTVKKYMPFIQLDSFTSENVIIKPASSSQELTKVTITVVYSVPIIRALNKQLEIVLFVAA